MIIYYVKYEFIFILNVFSYYDDVGHHPALVNPYLSKVYENIVGLQYRTVVDDHMSTYHVLGVVSKMDEALDLPEVKYTMVITT